MDEPHEHVPAGATPDSVQAREELEEARYFHDVCVALRTYHTFANAEIDRIERNFRMLSPEDAALLMENVDTRITNLRDGVNLNQSFLDILVSQAADVKGDDLKDCPSMENGSCRCLASSVNVSKVRSTLKQFAREWSGFRKDERLECYTPLLEGLKTWLPDSKKKWVLCPGSGLGRLPYEIRQLGYNAQGNEFSFLMLIGSYFMLNCVIEKESLAIKPYVLNTMNRRSHQDNLLTVFVPDVSPAQEEYDQLEQQQSGGGCEEKLEEDCGCGDSDFSMCAGEFCAIYGGEDQKGMWDSVVTCFFIDTARNIIQYVRTIAHLIKPGGVWLNLGPLLYHYAGEEDGMSIELSFEELRLIMEKWFDIKEVKNHDCLYTSHPRSLMQVVYHSIYFAAVRKPDAIASQESCPGEIGGGPGSPQTQEKGGAAPGLLRQRSAPEKNE